MSWSLDVVPQWREIRSFMMVAIHLDLACLWFFLGPTMSQVSSLQNFLFEEFLAPLSIEACIPRVNFSDWHLALILLLCISQSQTPWVYHGNVLCQRRFIRERTQSPFVFSRGSLKYNSLIFRIVYNGIRVYWAARIAKRLESGIDCLTREIPKASDLQSIIWWLNGCPEVNLYRLPHRKTSLLNRKSCSVFVSHESLL